MGVGDIQQQSEKTVDRCCERDRDKEDAIAMKVQIFGCFLCFADPSHPHPLDD